MMQRLVLMAVPVTMLVAVLAIAGCGEDDPAASGGAGGGAGTSGSACDPDEGLSPSDDATCTAAADDYTPRVAGSANDTWPACISDDNAYHPFDTSISSVARVGAFERIAALLAFDGSRVASAQDFIDARLAYLEDQGLESRVVRREDEHYPALSAACRDLSEADQTANADRCVGWTKIRPLLNDAFENGAQGFEPTVNAARVEAALLWFFYVSAHKEATTCATTAKDCDSSFAYYTGGEARDKGLGLARYVRARSPQAHDRTWDGILAVRCWRDLDNPTGEAQDTAMQQRALAQLDHALLRGVATIVRQRLQVLNCLAAWETVRILGPVLDRAANVRDAGAAASLRAEVSRTDAASVDATTAIGAIDQLFPCP